MDCCLALIAIIVTAISQAKSSQSARELDWSLFPQYHVPYDLSVWAYYRRRTPPVFTLEKYNCMLYDRYADNAGSPEHIPKDKIKSLCYEEMSARMLAIALLVIVLLRLGLKPLNDFVAWRRQNIEVRERKGGGFEDADVVSLTARSVAKSSEGRSSRTTVAMELPADRTSKVEMGNEGAVQEVPADGDVKKTGPHAIAYEMDGRANFATYELDGR